MAELKYLLSASLLIGVLNVTGTAAIGTIPVATHSGQQIISR